MPRVLIIDDEPSIRHILSAVLIESGFETAEAETGEEAVSLAVEFNPDVALLDMNLPGMGGLDTLRELLARRPRLSCIMMTAYGTIRSAVEAMRLGALDYLTKPFDNQELLMLIQRALELRRLEREVVELRAELSARYGFNEIVGASPKLQEVFRVMAKVAPIDATVLIEGESGTGKELVARAIHRAGRRGRGPFVAVNCGAIPASLFEAEFYGYERGAFTDARTSRAGYFEQAQGGTLFLDEVSELPAEAQVKLLRVLQDHQVTRLGARATVKVDVRVIAAANIDLQMAVERGRFREDLFWRLNVVRLRLPSLRQRREDIPLIVDHLLDRFNRELGLEVKTITQEARRLLELYEWPGNVRELENTLCSAMILCENGVITVQDLPPRLRGESDATLSTSAAAGEPRRLTLAQAVNDVAERVEKTMIIARLTEFNGNRAATAESLGVSRKTLFNKMRQYGLTDTDAEAGDAPAHP